MAENNRTGAAGEGEVVVGPWPGSSSTPPPPRWWSRRRGGEIPRRVPVDRWGGKVLMDCRECRRPWAPDVTIPRDRLCASCRADREDAAPGLFAAPDLGPGGA
ncbi:hypothetical protein [Nocardia cyriacigeorgica]|uniref:Uncharacterized protein n=1 Tax=Nocardia cyriacigeorgica TaxID=135487 RepID=A0A5R8NEI7_9NOCA|nr:hypothetical protein [Nocardia cyriacigeorgica]TLF74088.1 hypothetical protein FEK34_25560 [Nocardia cyriacigeorgica]